MSYKIPERLKGADGFSARVESFAVEYPENSPPHFIIQIVSDTGKPYALEFDQPQPDEALVAKALLFFRHDPVWREHFATTPATPFWIAHRGEALDAYDPIAASYFNALGIKTMSYNKGSSHPHGSACELAIFGRFPETVERIARSNDWLISDNRIRIKTPRGFSHLGRDAFTLLLDDWYSNCLDETGFRYRVVREEKPLFPDWPLYPESALKENEALNRAKTQKLNQLVSLGTFDQYAKLTSGRDTYSTMTTDQLIGLLGEDDEALVRLNDVADNPIIFTKTLRWRLRGLNVTHTLEKYRVDDILHNHAQNERERRREERRQARECMDASI